jgi:metallo-beta-lactamase family protein
MGEWKKVKAAVEIMTAFSAHADYAETLAWLKALDTGRLKRIFLVHGETEAQENLQHILMQNFFHDVEIVRYGATYTLH